VADCEDPKTLGDATTCGALATAPTD